MKTIPAMGDRRQRSGLHGRLGAGSAVKVLAHLAALLLLGPGSAVYAEPPDLRTPAPVIYLTDNLDEQDRLGWCIDTVGRGFGERLHAHSCKPRGGDVQFRYEKASRRIASATFSGKCATLLALAAAGVSLGLVDCAKDVPGQVFDYDTRAMEFRPGADRTLCLVVGASARSAGPYMSRSLVLAPCASTEAKFRQWRIKVARP